MPSLPAYLLASRQGIYRADREGARLLVEGHFFGIACRAGHVYAFLDTAFGDPDLDRPSGRIVRHAWRDGVLGPQEVLVDGLNQEVHQLAFLGERLFVVDTGHQSVLEFDAGFHQVTSHRVAPPAPCRGEGDAYPNAILCTSDAFYVMLHNYKRNMPSEIVVFDPDFRERARILLIEDKCHDIARLAGGRLLYCASTSGCIAATDGTVVKIDGNMTRGLVVGENEILVGSSLFGQRVGRKFLPGYLAFLDPAFNVVHRYYIPAAPTQICALTV